MVKRISRAFKDISLSFNMHPVTKDILVLKNEDAVKRSIINIINTIPGEKLFNSKFGSSLSSSIFEFVDFATASVLQSQILNAIQSYEPRVENVKVEVNPRYDSNDFEVMIYFDIIGQSLPSQQEFTYILEATRR